MNGSVFFVFFWQMFEFVRLNASSKKNTVGSLWEARSVGLQTKPKNIIHCYVIQTSFHGRRQSKGIVLLNIILG